MLNFTFSIFLLAQQSEWYPMFLKPAADAVLHSVQKGQILDIGTGPGTFPRILSENQDLYIRGSDIDPSMIDTARSMVTASNTDFFLQKGSTFPQIKDASMDAVTFCSVLFLLDDGTAISLLDESLRILKPGGRIIVLSPSADNRSLSDLKSLGLSPISSRNWTIYFWRFATLNRAKFWNANHFLSRYADRHGLKYSEKLVFGDLAVLEELIKK